ncbi:glycosyl hydrolase [Lewinella sp. 4G2]|nr:glycosyl hydrolase [Lewinella sp. 4G2]
MLASSPVIDVIIPAYNEEDSIALVVNELPKAQVRDIIVCNNNSRDHTAERGAAAGAVVVTEKRAGYGSACLKGMQYIEDRPQAEWPDIVVFVDGDHSDYPEQLPELVAPILTDGVDLVIGSRALGDLEPGSMQPQQIFGNWLATTLIKMIYGNEFTDLGPFRAIRYSALRQLEMEDPDFGWTVEMQVKAAKAGMKCVEVPVRYRKRIGQSKISGTLKGTILAGHKILWTIFKLI